ncbi:hypothetical protein JW707_00805, partial [Candidatus Woesearchaeota archaeon]|nr:hypothetical protein [Candidatus Woesearchaeota archaeon]
MAKKKKVGVLEYRDEKYIKEVMKIVKKNTDANVDFFGLGQHEFRKPGEFDVIFDMISPFNKYISEIMKVYYLNGAYIINNPFVVTTYNKIIQTYKLMEMNMPFPRTVVLPNESDETETGFVDKPYFKSIL